MDKFIRTHKALLPYYLFFILLTGVVLKNPFFWDTVQLGSEHAAFYFNHHLKLILLPESIDSGHIPAFGYSLAALWKIFGKSLPVSHLFILPFLLGIVSQSKRLLEKFIAKKNLYYALTLFLCGPTLLAQATLISPDIPLVYFFLLQLNAVFEKKKLPLLIAVIGLALISMRGWMTALLLFAFEQYLLHREKNSYFSARLILKNLKYYLPGGLIAVIYLIIHYHIEGWIGYHKGSPWAECFEPVNLQGFLRNILIYGWRLIDFGRLVIWLIFFLLFRKWLVTFSTDKNVEQLSVLAGLYLIVFPVSMLLHRNLLGERYLLPVFMTFTLFVIYLLFEKSDFKAVFKRLIALLSILMLLGGNTIIYPDKIAQSWDSSLAYLPYFDLRKKAIDYMNIHHIAFDETGTVFPNTASFAITDLKNSDSSFAKKDFSVNHYFFYSNVFNDITDSEYVYLHLRWKKLKTFEKRGIRVTLFQHPKFMN